MSTVDEAPPTAADGVQAAPVVRFGMRAKVLVAFVLAFTAVFGLLTWAVIRHVTDQAQTRLVEQLHDTALGTAQSLDSAALRALLTALPSESSDFAALNENPEYRAQTAALNTIFAVTGGPLPTGGLQGGELVDPAGVRPYTYFLNSDGRLYWMTTPAAAWDPIPPTAMPWRGSVAAVVGEPSAPGQPRSTYDHMLDGLSAPTDQPAYSDVDGDWISTYVPLPSTDGPRMGLGADYSTSYVDEVRMAAIGNIVPLLVVGYLLLLWLVLIVSTWLTRPLKRLTAATAATAAGDYDIDLSSLVRSRIPDEMNVLAASFTTMVSKVRARERNLTTQVRKLKVEIDHTKRERALKEITDSDFFASLTAKAAIARQRMSELDEIDRDSDGDAARSPGASDGSG